MSQRLLLDTCAALWYWSGSERLSDEVIEVIMDPENEVIFHQVSYLEITLKYSLGKLELKEPPSVLIPQMIAASDFSFHRIENRDIAGLEGLEFHHRDPFDRLLIAHAMVNELSIVTSDSQFFQYPVRVIDAS